MAAYSCNAGIGHCDAGGDDEVAKPGAVLRNGSEADISYSQASGDVKARETCGMEQ